ncbi:acyl-CoA dehydrogenase family protein [Tardiphaga sp. 803_E3_N1_3]|uniref:acyl-CoA dehydrogenase family protein n=1 Tax=Tardiphaga sp. 803_E3_N1_3 TaxID=3240785 RepID=UPI003F228023
MVFWNPTLPDVSRNWQEVAATVADKHFAPLVEELDRDQRYPWENVKVLVENGLTGLFIPEEFGGGGQSLLTTAAVVEAVGKRCSSTAAILCTYQLGAFPVLLAGRDDQKRFYLEHMTKGVSTSFALSERSTGSDAAAIEATAVREGNGWRLRGEKYWIGNGGASRFYVVFAKTEIDGKSGISAFMVDQEVPGVVVDELSDKMGIRGTQTSNLKLDVVVPDDAMIGPPNKALKLALQTLNVGRVLVAAQSTGLAMAAFEDASSRAVARKTFGAPIIQHQGIGNKLADVATELSAARMMLFETARTYDAGGNIATLGAMTKLFCSEAAHKAADVAVQVWGGVGYCKPNLSERLYRDQRILEIYEGSSEIQRLVLARAIQSAA